MDSAGEPAAGQSVPRWVSSLESRADLLGFIDLCWPVDGVADAFPDGWEAASERGFYVVDRLEDGFVGTVKQRRDLIDAEEGVGVEDEGDEKLAGGEFLIVERCAAGVGDFPVTASAPDAG